jgi:serine/threonine protein kinase
MALLTDGMWPNDSYEVEAFIGEGAFAEVYRVRHKFLERRAMKIFKAPGSSSDELAEMLREAVLLSKMNHPNVVRVYEAGMVNMKEDTHVCSSIGNRLVANLCPYRWSSISCARYARGSPLPTRKVRR